MFANRHICVVLRSSVRHIGGPKFMHKSKNTSNLVSTKISIDLAYPTLDHVCSDRLYIVINVT